MLCVGATCQCRDVGAIARVRSKLRCCSCAMMRRMTYPAAAAFLRNGDPAFHNVRCGSSARPAKKAHKERLAVQIELTSIGSLLNSGKF